MRNMMKARISAILLCLTVLSALLPTAALADAPEGLSYFGEVKLTVGETYDLSVLGVTGGESDDTDVAWVDDTGVIHAAGAGSAGVTLSMGGAPMFWCQVIVEEAISGDEIVGNLKLLARYNDSMQFYDGHVYLLFTSYLDGVTITVDDLYGAYALSEQYYEDIRADIANGSNHTGTDTEPYFTFSDTTSSVTLDRGEIVTIGMYRGFDLSVMDAALGTVKNSSAVKKLQQWGILGKAALGSIESVCKLVQSGALSFEDAIAQLKALGGSMPVGSASLFDGVVEGGVCFNRELYNQKLEWDQYENVTYEAEITRDQLDRMAAALVGNRNNFSILKNSCATVALRAWNAAMGDDMSAQLTATGSGIFALMDAPKTVRDAMVDRFSTWDGYYHNSALGGDPDAGYIDETGWVYVSAPKHVTNYIYEDETVQIDRVRTNLPAFLNTVRGETAIPYELIEQEVLVAVETAPAEDEATTIERVTFTYDDGTVITADGTTPFDGLWLRMKFDQAKDYNTYAVTDETGKTLPSAYEDGTMVFRADHLPITVKIGGTLNESRVVGRLTIHARTIQPKQLVPHVALTFTTYEDVELPISYYAYYRPTEAYKALIADYRDNPEAYASDPALDGKLLRIEERALYFDELSGAVNADPAALEPVALRRGESCTISCYSLDGAVASVLSAFTGNSAMAGDENVQKLLAQLMQYMGTGEADLPEAAFSLMKTLAAMYAGALQTGSNPANGRVARGGIAVDRELYNQFVNADTQLPNNWYSVELTAPELEALIGYLSDPDNNYYALFSHNCTTAVVDAWNAALADRPALRLKGNYSGFAEDSESLYVELGLMRLKSGLDGVGGTNFTPRTVGVAAAAPEVLYHDADYAVITCRDEDWNYITDQVYVIARAGEEPDWSRSRRLEGSDKTGYDLRFEGLEPYTAYTVYARLADAYHSAPTEAKETSFTTDPLIEVEGAPCVGGTLTVVWQPESLNPDVQWFYYDEEEISDESMTPIEGATGASYSVTEDELGKCLCVIISKDGERLTSTYYNAVDYGASAPVLPESADFADSMSVTITAAEGTTVYYSTDGRYPGWYGEEYTEPFTITETTTVKALAYSDEAPYESPVVSETYTLAAPSDTPATGGTDTSSETPATGGSGGGSSSSTGGGSSSGGSSVSSGSGTAPKQEVTAPKTAMPDGSTVSIIRDVNGAFRSAEVSLSEQAVSSGKAVIALGTSGGSGVVAFERLEDGSLRVVKESRVEDDNIIVPVSESRELVIADNSKVFADVDASRWYADYVAFVTAREIFGGTNKGFEPNAEMTRAMVARMLYNFDRNSKPVQTDAFRDVDAGKWFADAVGWASASGIVTGSKGLFRPNDPVTRQELVTILYRYAQYAGCDVSGDGDLSGWRDADSVSAYAREAMSWALRVGVIDGIDGALAPRSNATRAQVAAIMTRFVRNVV